MIKKKSHLKVLITAGPTREYFDPVRFISNPSSGKMGIELASESRHLFSKVCLIMGPTFLELPEGVQLVKVVSAREMHRELIKKFYQYDLIIMCAAVSDTRPKVQFKKKQKKKDISQSMELVLNPDLLAWAGKHKRNQIVVGFAAQTHQIFTEARRKLIEKQSDFIVANKVGEKGVGFKSAWIKGALMDKNNIWLPLKKRTKKLFAKQLLKWLLKRI